MVSESMGTALAILSVFCGCQVNVMALEVIINHKPFGPSFGVELTLLQFITVAFLSTFLNIESVNAPDPLKALPMYRNQRRWTFFGVFRFRRRILGADKSVFLALACWLLSVLNNYVFKYELSMPLVNTFRSSSLAVTIGMGAIMGQKFSWQQVLTALIVSVGIGVLTVTTIGAPDKTAQQKSNELMGVFVLALAIVQSALVANVQSKILDGARAQVGKERSGGLWRESMWLCHLLAIPLFFLPDPMAVVDKIASTPPELYGPILLNVLSQFVCIRGVWHLVCNTSTLTMQMTITTRKFISIVVSIIWFGHWRTMDSMQWISTLAVALAASAYPFLPKAKTA